MKRRPLPQLAAVALLASCLCLHAEPPAAAVAAFNTYTAAVESRLARQHSAAQDFLVPIASAAETDLRLRHGEILIEQLTPPTGTALPGALLHHWRATAFAPGATASDLDRLLRNLPAYPRHFAPEVLQASLVTQRGDTLQATMRVRQHHILTVVLDTAYDITFGRLDPRHAFSLSRSTRIAEIAAPGTPAEHALAPADEHGFLWRQNTYWSCEERDGGLYLQVESISLSRAIPHGLAWAIQPFVETIPRDSLEFTLRSTRTALRQNNAQ